MISPQHLINTGICGLFCVTLFSLAGVKSQARPIAATQPVSIGQDYTLHIKTGNVQQRISSPGSAHEVKNTRSLEQRNQDARVRRAQFEQLFTQVPSQAATHLTGCSDKAREEQAIEILRRARNAVHHGVDVGQKESSAKNFEEVSCGR